jgi:hypothetical protein
MEGIVNYNIPSAVPTLKVMRIQSPQLSKSQAPSMSSPHLSSSLILPDSFGVIHIGETFTAYLGAISVSQSTPVTNLSVSSTLQTPTKRWPLPSALDNKLPTTAQERLNYKPMHIFPQSQGQGHSHGGVDAIISTPLEEVGQHILRVDVSYGGPDPKLPPLQQDDGSYNNNNNSNNPNNNNRIQPVYHPRKTLRKFYRFHVSSPLHMKELTLRGGESSCFVSLAVENAAPIESGGGLTISQTEFQPFAGLIAKRIQSETIFNSNSNNSKKKKSAVELYDECGRLNPGESRRYLFTVKAASEDAALRGIARGDELGKAVVTWRKAMGEAGRIASTFVCCPSSDVGNAFEEKESSQIYPNPHSNVNSNNGNKEEKNGDDGKEDRFVVHGSGLSVDVAASAAERSAASHAPSEISTVKTLDAIFPITVEPIDPPEKMKIGDNKPITVQLLVVNHSSKVQNLQLQMRLPLMKGVVVCGQSWKNLGEIQPDGGSEVVSISLIAMSPGFFFVKGCFVVNLNTGMEIKQPSLFSIFVEDDDNKDENERKVQVDDEIIDF